jgi:prepilin peptidase CpaA
VVAGSALDSASSVVLVVSLTVACASDLRARRIPNVLVLLLAISGFVIAALTTPWLTSLAKAGAGLGVGLAIWLPFYVFRMLGAGDVKLFAAASTLLGPSAAVEAALYTALFGGLVALMYMIGHSGLTSTLLGASHALQQPTLLRNTPGVKRPRLPYALAIAAGVLTAFWWPGHLVRF